jgi:hypothetical protein
MLNKLCLNNKASVQMLKIDTAKKLHLCGNNLPIKFLYEIKSSLLLEVAEKQKALGKSIPKSEWSGLMALSCSQLQLSEAIS